MGELVDGWPATTTFKAQVTKQSSTVPPQTATKEPTRTSNMALTPSDEATCGVYSESYVIQGIIILSEVMFDSACEALHSSAVCGRGFNDETQFEWAEIFNTAATIVDLTGWSICDESHECDSLSGSIPSGGFWVIAHNDDAPIYDLQDEFGNYDEVVNNAKTVLINSPIGNGLAQDGDVVYLKTGDSSCGDGDDDCVADCVSWDGSNSCVALIASANSLGYLTGADGYDDTGLTNGNQDGQSIVNMQ